MNRIGFTALFLLGLCAGSAFGQYPAGCSKASTPSGFTGCELTEIKQFAAEAKSANSDKAHQLALLKHSYAIEALTQLHPGMVYQDASSQKTADAKKKFQEQWPDGRLVPKGTR